MRQIESASRKVIQAASAAGLMAGIGPGMAASPADPSGVWLTEDERARIRIERCGAKLEQICGYIVWMKEPTGDNGQPLRDEWNPDPGKRSRPLLGHQLIAAVPQRSDGRFDGRIYNSEDGKSYDVS